MDEFSCWSFYSMPKIFKYVLSFFIVFAIIGLSLLPAQDMYRTGAPKGGEHFVAYLGAALLMGFAFRGGWRRGLLIAAGFVALAGLLECLQRFSPGRTPHFSDFLASAAGVVSGFVVMEFLSRRVLSMAGRRSGDLCNDS
ncbi:VanZ family protein [Ancylobacter sp. Lp-2]|uniref:VanZ family protein n=1 Tax=Ancylobacter sp. Lp-2 TaxID=2881339 RepID=UPI001E3C8E95|nr:VanZ family protein [Ancylobacter sp. Lp-2]MCB4769593.1 VanZ family protein [Ancylobacter sp. Lp-2]